MRQLWALDFEVAADKDNADVIVAGKIRRISSFDVAAEADLAMVCGTPEEVVGADLADSHLSLRRRRTCPSRYHVNRLDKRPR